MKYDRRTRAFTRYSLPIRDAVPYIVRLDEGIGAVWVGTSAGDAVLRLTPATGQWTSYPMPTPGALVRHLAIDPRTHDVWVAPGASPFGEPARVARIRVGPATH